MEEVNYRQAVRGSVNKEFEDFKQTLLASNDTQKVFDAALEINTKRELLDVLDGDYISATEYRALYQERDEILKNLYDGLCAENYVPANNEYVLAEAITMYCKDRYADIYEEENATRYFGKDETDIGYYYMPKGLTSQALHDIKEPCEYYVIASPVCCLSPEIKAKHRITFLKIDRDIEERELKIDMAKSNMERAVVALIEKERDMTNLPNNIACKLSIEKGIKENYDGLRLGKDFEEDIIREHGIDRVLYVLANTIQQKQWDGRFSSDNKKWAREYQIPEDTLNRCFVVESHPAVVDGFINRIRKMEQGKSKIYFTKIEEKDDYGETVGYSAVTVNENDGYLYNLLDNPFPTMEKLTGKINALRAEHPTNFFIEKSPTELLAMSNIIQREKRAIAQQKDANKKEFAKKWKQDNTDKKGEIEIE
ncbi:MAG: DUF3849 domain-containing protein [Clostridia bacterium]|nr:DUF3849 domain-containing protein [Clostridia bacterium]